MTRIFLIGYMGAGKTTLGKAFAREMSLNFIDLDWFIEERFHKTVQHANTIVGNSLSIAICANVFISINCLFFSLLLDTTAELH